MFTKVYSKEKPKLIYLDPGHGGFDQGAMHNGISEASINLNVSYNIKERLEQVGYKVLMTRYGDYDLSTTNENRKRQDIHKRVKLINDSDAILYLTVHVNAINSPVWYGAQTFFKEGAEESSNLAKKIQYSMRENLKNTDREAKSISNKYLIDHTNKTGVLVELGFLSNPSEGKLLTTSEYQATISYFIFVGIMDFLSNKSML